MLIIGGSGSGKTNALLNLISQHGGIDKVYLYAKDLSKPKYEFLVRNCESVGVKHCNDLNHLLSVQILWMTSMKILIITNQAEKEIFNCV